MVKLSILIPSLPNRIDKLKNLLNRLEPQITNEVELIILTDNKTISLGEKRNKLLNLAHGEYIVGIDDDDMVSDDYVEQILEAMQTKPDLITFDMEISINGGPYKKVFFSKHYQNTNYTDCYYRKPHGLMCYRKEIAIKERFSDITFREDSDYSERIIKHINSEYNIPKTLYYYNFIQSESETDGIKA